MLKNKLFIIASILVILLLLFGQFMGMNQVFIDLINEVVPFKAALLFYAALAIIVLAFFLGRCFPLLGKIIFILVGGLFAALAAAVLVAFLFLIFYGWMRGSSVACDMGGGGIAAILLGIYAAAITYGLVLVIGISLAIFKHLKKKKTNTNTN
jgi:hypothetical protein